MQITYIKEEPSRIGKIQAEKMPEITITGFRTRDVRFPTSLDKTGSDAMNAAGDYSSAYCILETDSEFTGHGMVEPPSTPPFQNITPNAKLD